MFAADITDPQNERLILLAAGGLVLLGIFLTYVTVRWWRQTRPEHPVLAGLRVMSTKRWRAADSETQSRKLSEVRARAQGRRGPDPVASGVSIRRPIPAPSADDGGERASEASE